MPNHILSSYIARGCLLPQVESWKQDFTTSHFQNLPLLGLPPCLEGCLYCEFIHSISTISPVKSFIFLTNPCFHHPIPLPFQQKFGIILS